VDVDEADEAEFPGVDPVIADDIKIPGVDVESEAPQTVEINDLAIPATDPPTVEVAPAKEATLQAPAPVQEPAEPLVLRRSTRARNQTKPEYTPSMTGSKHAFAVTQLEEHGVLYPDAHMFAQSDFYQSDPNVVASIMTQLSLKVGLKEWG
jgi:hypothetical protein